ncbi:hypothetical protein CMO88_04010 [Candidatus Woesearchaeota archaeon]|nr:hypothetical protein [Candidatus Woesearchaeota archaeon]|tara:strand:- start:1412 stop:1603 length:192 start_codon:yes stop_codon:yes gene_type:complete
MEENFKKKTLNSFTLMRDDMDRFTESMNDWILFLNSELKEAKSTVNELQKRISELEMEKRLRF